MFSIDEKIENGFRQVILSDDESQTTARILPACGGLLHGFDIIFDGKPLNVVDHYDDYDDYKINKENKGFKSAKLSPFVCRVNNGKYRFAEQEYRIEKFYLQKNAIHGLLYDADFTVTDQRASAESAYVTMNFSYTGSDPGYPFHYECKIKYELAAGNSLSLETTIINRDEGYIPVADGWHPYFTFGGQIDRLQLEFQSLQRLEFDQDMIPTGQFSAYQEFCSIRQIGKETFDDFFTLNFAECQPMLVLKDPGTGLRLEIMPEKSYPYLQIYTPEDRRSIAFENLSAAPDAFNNAIGLVVLEPGGQRTFKTVYKLRAGREE